MTARGVLALALIGCGGGSDPAPLGERVGPALTAAFAAAESVRAPWRCAAADVPMLAVETLKVGTHTWKLAGHAVTLEGKGSVTIGVIADAGGAAPATLAALGRLRTQLATADLVITLGGMGGTQVELEATLGTLAERAPYPIVALAGDLESVTAQSTAIQALRARGHVVIDARHARTIELPGATIATVPGATSAARLVAGGDGCSYTAADVAAMFAVLSPQPGLRILASFEAPRTVVNGEPAGQLALTSGAAQHVDIALHGPITGAPSPARTGGRDGGGVALTPGTCDATTRLPGPRHAPSAGLLTLGVLPSGATWRWKPIVDIE